MEYTKDSKFYFHFSNKTKRELVLRPSENTNILPITDHSFDSDDYFDDSDADPDFILSKEDKLEIMSDTESVSSTISRTQEQNINFTSTTEPSTTSTLSRKRKRHPQKWKKNVLKACRQSGKEYIDKKGNLMRSKEVQKKLCSAKCPYKCVSIINVKNQEEIHSHFWRLTDDEKNHFYSKFVTQIPKKKTRKTSQNVILRFNIT